MTEVLHDHIFHITVDQAEKCNALTPKVVSELSDALTELDNNSGLWIGVLSFAGDHTTAGLDMPLFFAPDAEQPERRAGAVDPFGLESRLSKPLIAAVQGITFTVGIELALTSDIIVAASDARFCQLEPKRGLAAIGGATTRYVQRAGWGNAMYHLLRADEFDADEAYRIGLIQEVVAPGTQVERALELATEMLACAPIALQQMIANSRTLLDSGEAAAIAGIATMSEHTRATADFAEGIASFVERRPAEFTGR